VMLPGPQPQSSTRMPARKCGRRKAACVLAVRAALANPGTVTLPHALLTN
jgi:hypothetical protein